jgi:hypothetical protein
MTLRPIHCLAAGSILVALIVASRATRAWGQPPDAGDAALNHWVFDAKDVDEAEIRRHADKLVAHMQQAHPETTFTLFKEFVEVRGNYVHFFLETINSTAQQLFLEAYGRDDECRALLEYENTSFGLREDVYLRLIASDPEKERRIERFGGAVVWQLETCFPRAGQAVECVEELVRHLNATYPEFFFRGYDEWFPESGRIRIYAFGTGIAAWEKTEARIRRDPVVRGLFEGAAEAFVEGGFSDTWLVTLVQG